MVNLNATGHIFLSLNYSVLYAIKPLRKYLGEKVNFLGGKFTSEKLT